MNGTVKLSEKGVALILLEHEANNLMLRRRRLIARMEEVHGQLTELIAQQKAVLDMIQKIKDSL